MAMNDMLHNAARHRHLTCQHFVDRQKLIHKYDLNRAPLEDDKLRFKNIYAEQRHEFLQYFHLFAQTDPLNNPQRTWTAFLKVGHANGHRGCS